MSRRSVALLVVLALAAVGGWWWWSRSSAVTPADAIAEAPLERPLVARAEPRPAGLDAAPCSASGRVLRASDGTGVADAVVLLQQPRAVAPPEPIVVRTDASGQWSAEGLRPGRWTLSASTPTHAPGLIRALVLSPGKDHAGLELVLTDAPAVLAGVITDPTGAAIVDARVELSPVVERNTGSAVAFAATSDREGRYRIGVTHDGYMARVVHRDHVSTMAYVIVTSDGTRTRHFVLAPGGVIRGRVLARADGQPVAGALVHRTATDGSILGTGHATDHNYAITEPDGAFELRGLPAGAPELVAAGPGATSTEPTSVPLGVAETVEGIELLVDVGYTVAGYVVADDDDTVGIGGVTVGIVDFTHASRIRMSDPSADDGAFTVHGLLPGRYTVMVYGDEIVPTMIRTLDVAPRDAQDVLVRATRGRRVRGRIEPPGRAVVRLAVPLPRSDDDPAAGNVMARMMCTYRSFSTASDGTFEIGPVIPGAYRIEADGAAVHGVLDVQIAEHDTTEIAVPMERGLTVSGTVRDGSGSAVPGVTVSLTRTEQRPVLSLAAFVGGGAGTAVADADGRFVIGALEPGSYTYEVSDDAGVRMPWHAAAADPVAPRTLELDRNHDLAIVLAPAQTLSGRVVDPEGHAVAGAWVSVWPKLDVTELQLGKTVGTPFSQKPKGDVLESLHRQTSRLFAGAPVLSDSEGRFQFGGLRRDRYSLSAHAGRGQLRGELLDRPANDDVTLVVQPLARLRVVLAGDDDPGGALRVTVDGSETQARTFRPARELAIERLLPGHWRVTVEAPNGMAKGEVELAGGATGELRLDLAPWASVRGRVVDVRTGAPQAGLYPIVASPTATLGEVVARASAMVGAMSGGAELRIDADGRFELEQSPPGALDVTFMEMPGFEVVAMLHLDDLQPGEVRDMGDVAGLPLEAVPKAEAGALGIDPTTRDDAPLVLVVEAIAPRSPAARAGLRVDDRILAVDDAEVARLGARVVGRALVKSHLRSGSRHRVRVDRKGTTIDVELTAEPAGKRGK